MFGSRKLVNLMRSGAAWHMRIYIPKVVVHLMGGQKEATKSLERRVNTRFLSTPRMPFQLMDLPDHSPSGYGQHAPEGREKGAVAVLDLAFKTYIIPIGFLCKRCEAMLGFRTKSSLNECTEPN